VSKTTPNETIRRAAEALDLAGAGAKQSAAGRWYVDTPDGGYPQRILDNAVFIAEGYEGPRSGEPVVIAPFIASMDPTIAFGVAKLLEAVADADLADIHAAAVDLAVDYLRETRECGVCGMKVGLTAAGELGEHGTMRATCPGEPENVR
jgi:hypothetical protein